MTHINLSQTGESPFQRLLGHNDQILKNWIQLETSVFTDSSLGLDLLEQVRKTLAFGNKFENCRVVGRRPGITRSNRREQLATAFAELFVLDHTSIYTGHFKVLEEEFNEKEISELCSFISFVTASQRLGRIFNLTEEYQQNNAESLQEIKMSS